MNISENAEKKLIPYRKKNQWGYMDYESKEIVIPCIYDTAYGFRYDRAIVIIQEKYGVIDMNGKEILPAIYDNIPYLHEEGIYLREKTDKTCFDLNGKVIIPLSDYKEHFITFFCDNASDPEKRHLFFDDNGKLKISRKYLGMDKHGIRIIGSTWVTDNGEVFILPERCDFRGRFQEGLICVMDFTNINNIRYGFMNPAKEFVIPLELEVDDHSQCGWGWEGSFGNGLTMARKNGKIGFINQQNELVIPRIYDNYDGSYEFENGFCTILKDNQSGVIDTHGNVVIPFAYDEDSIMLWTKNRWIIFDNGKFLVLSKGAQIVVPEDRYDLITLMHDYDTGAFSQELARVGKDGLYGFIDEDGNEVIPLIYTESSAIEYGVIPVKKDGYYGVIDKNGHVIIPFKYPDSITPKEDRLFSTTMGWIDYTGFEYWED